MAVLAGALMVLVAACGAGTPPEATASTEEATVSIDASSYCWSSRFGDSGACAHGPLTSPRTPLQVAFGGTVSLRFGREPSVDLIARVRGVDTAAAVEQDGGILGWHDATVAEGVPLPFVSSEPLTAALYEPPGLYLINIYADFDRGDAVYGFLIEVIE